MPIGKSSRIVIDVDDVGLKRDLYAALATEGRSLKDWFSTVANEYLSIRPRRAGRVSEQRAEYHVESKKRKS